MYLAFLLTILIGIPNPTSGPTKTEIQVCQESYPLAGECTTLGECKDLCINLKSLQACRFMECAFTRASWRETDEKEQCRLRHWLVVFGISGCVQNNAGSCLSYSAYVERGYDVPGCKPRTLLERQRLQNKANRIIFMVIVDHKDPWDAVLLISLRLIYGSFGMEKDVGLGIYGLQLVCKYSPDKCKRYELKKVINEKSASYLVPVMEAKEYKLKSFSSTLLKYIKMP